MISKSPNKYNYESFIERSDRSIFRNSPIRAGTKVPDIIAEMLNGSTFRLSDHRGKNVVLEFGCSTCPPFIDSLCNDFSSLSRLYRNYIGRNFRFFIVYTRETHPGESIWAHKTFSGKKRHARMLKQEYDVEIPIIVDNLNGTIHKMFGMMPNMVYVIGKDGTIIYRSEWFDYSELKQVLDRISRRQDEVRTEFGWGYSEFVKPREQIDAKLSERTYLKAGKKAVKDAEKVFS